MPNRYKVILSRDLTVTPGASIAGTNTGDGATLVSSREYANIIASAPAVNIDLSTSLVWYFTSYATANWTHNFRASSSLSLNALMAIGESITIVILTNQDGVAYIPTAWAIDGVAVTPKWANNFPPTVGNINSIDTYTYTIIKTANATFQVFAAITQFK